MAVRRAPTTAQGARPPVRGGWGSGIPSQDRPGLRGAMPIPTANRAAAIDQLPDFACEEHDIVQVARADVGRGQV